MKLNLEGKSQNEKLIIAYLEENASESLAEKINTGKKTMEGCMAYIISEARQQAQKGVAMIDDATVYGWAVHFFEEDEIKEAKAPTQAAVVHKPEKAPEPKPEKKPEKAPEKPKQEPQLAGQMNIYDFLGGMQ